jgi:nickel/cobalt transporter (NiCoT) family protein
MANDTSRLRALRDALTPWEWLRCGGMAATVLGLNVLGWGIFVLVVLPAHYRFHGAAVGFGVAITAYTLGMRHAFDADHISAIDNTTRKLMAEGERPLSVGFWFSLGHSSIVVGLGVALTLAAKSVFHAVNHHDSPLASFGGIFGTTVSGTFLYVIAAINLFILASIVRIFLDMRRGLYDEEALEVQLASRGLTTRVLGRFTGAITRPWHMYPIGAMFGLGFDTATEVALRAATAGAAESRLPWYAVICLPILFTAGMTLFDTLDGSFMNFAYGWAFSRPIRKVYYNITITGLSVLVAFLIGTIELFGLLATELHLRGMFWSSMAHFNINAAGFVIVGLFAGTWIVALAIWRFGRIEARWEAGAASCRAAELE